MDESKKTITAFLLDPANHDILAILKGLRNGLVYGTKIRFPHALVMTFLFRDGPFREKIISVLKATKQHAVNLGTFVTIYKSTIYILTHHPNLFPIPFLTNSTGVPLNPSKGSPHPIHTFIAGLIGGYYVFGRENNPINQQIVLYVFARVMLALAKLLVYNPSTSASGSLSPTPTSSATTAIQSSIPSGGGIGGGRGGSLLPQRVMGRDIRDLAWPVFASMSWGAVMYLFNNYPDTIQASLRSSMQYLYVDSERWNGWRDFLVHNK